MGYLEQLEKDIEILRKLILDFSKQHVKHIFYVSLPVLRAFFPDDKRLQVVKIWDCDDPEFRQYCMGKIQKLLDKKLEEFEKKESIIMRKRLKIIELEAMTWRKKEYEKSERNKIEDGPGMKMIPLAVR